MMVLLTITTRTGTTTIHTKKKEKREDEKDPLIWAGDRGRYPAGGHGEVQAETREPPRKSGSIWCGAAACRECPGFRRRAWCARTRSPPADGPAQAAERWNRPRGRLKRSPRPFHVSGHLGAVTVCYVTWLDAGVRCRRG
jgi:hypothetical protein